MPSLTTWPKQSSTDIRVCRSKCVFSSYVAVTRIVGVAVERCFRSITFIEGHFTIVSDTKVPHDIYDILFSQAMQIISQNTKKQQSTVAKVLFSSDSDYAYAFLVGKCSSCWSNCIRGQHNARNSSASPIRLHYLHDCLHASFSTKIQTFSDLPVVEI